MVTSTQTSTIIINGIPFTIKTEISTDNIIPPKNLVAKAGNDFTANMMEGQNSITVQLDGSKSTGNITKSIWSQTSGASQVKISDDSKLITDFTVSQPGIYAFLLAVGDNEGHASTDGLIITITKAGVEPPPSPDGDKDPGLPNDKFIEQPQKGGNKNPHTWAVVQMVKNPALSKVVDDKLINIAVEFSTSANAHQYIDHFVYLKDHEAPPVDHHCADGEHWDESLQKCVENTPVPTGDKIDTEGIQKIYKDDPSKVEQQFFIHKDGNTSPRLSGKGDRKILPDGSIEITPTQGTSPASARIYIRTTDGSFDYNEQLKRGWDWSVNLSRKDKDGVNRGGWMYTFNDYREIEATHYYKIPKINIPDEMTNYVGGGHPSDDNYPLQCISSCYKAQLQTKDASGRSAIEWDHFSSPDNYAWNDVVNGKFDLKAALGGTMENKIIGQKYVRYNEVKDGKVVAVHQELWLDLESKDLPKPDLSKQKWQFYIEYIHDGTNWPTKPKFTGFIKGCNAAGITMPCWGAPVYAMRFDESNWILYYLSVRPIVVEKME